MRASFNADWTEFKCRTVIEISARPNFVVLRKALELRSDEPGFMSVQLVCMALIDYHGHTHTLRGV